MFSIKKTLLYNSRLLKRNLSINPKIFESLNNPILNSNKLNPIELIIKFTSSIFGFPFGMCSIKPNHVLTYYTFGKYDGYRTSGLNWIPPVSHIVETFCGDTTLSHNNMHLTDSSSNPIIVSTFIIYNIINPVNNSVNLNSPDVLSNWIENIVRQVISTYSYEELTSNQTKNNMVNDLVQKINSDSKSELYGIQIQRAGILQLNYSTEIAETMLVKQKAKATIEARKELVDATMNIIEDVGKRLDGKLSPEDKSKLVTCLTVSMIGNQSPSHVINLN